MEKRNGFLTFLAALIPGVGYMYLGLVKKGVQVLVLFLLIPPVFRLLGIGFLGDIIRIPIWFYTFFDTFNLSAKLNKGEHVEDSDFIFNKNYNGEHGTIIDRVKLNRNLGLAVAWGLIVIGVLAILNKAFETSEIYHLFRNYVNIYFFPVLLIFFGIFVLLKQK